MHYLNLERYFLVWWPEEDKVSILPEHDILDGASAAVGESCIVSCGKMSFIGKISAIGNFNAMFVPFSRCPPNY